MEYQVFGELAQYVQLTFERGETCWAAKGAIMSYGDGMTWRLRVPGGIGGATRRLLSGESPALAFVEAEKNGASTSFASSRPGTISTWNLADGPVLTTRGSFLAAWGNVDITVTVARRAGAALFGGAGLFLQRLSGSGMVMIHAAGDPDPRTLSEGESLTVSTGHLAAFGDGVDYDIEYVGGLRKALFSGEGVFMTRLRGPGPVLLQTLKRKRELVTRSG